MLDTALLGVPVWLILLLVAGASAAAFLLKPKEKQYSKEEYEAVFGKEKGEDKKKPEVKKEAAVAPKAEKVV